MNIEKVKTHLKENCKVYIGVASGITVGVAATIFIHNNGVYNILNSFNFNWKSTNIGFIIPDRRGHPGWVVKCLETDNIFPSQNLAAEVMNLSASRLSSHLNGLTDNVQGFHFERICEAKAAA